MNKACSIENCNKVHYGRGWCAKHYQRWRQFGNPMIVYGRIMERETPEHRYFWLHVTKSADPNACWLWNTGTDIENYGKATWENKPILAHQLSWFIEHGVMPKMALLHSCDVPACVNPNHLREGTCKENSEDSVQRGRNIKGSRHPLAVLTESKVRRIKRLLQQGRLSQRAIADQFKVNKSKISHINTGISWKHVSI